MSTFDQTFFEAKEVGCSGWIPVLQVLDNGLGCASTPLTVTIGAADAVLSSLVGKKFLHRFRFASVDEVNNAHLGWHVDNARLEIASP